MSGTGNSTAPNRLPAGVGDRFYYEIARAKTKNGNSIVRDRSVPFVTPITPSSDSTHSAEMVLKSPTGWPAGDRSRVYRRGRYPVSKQLPGAMPYMLGTVLPSPKPSTPRRPCVALQCSWSGPKAPSGFESGPRQYHQSAFTLQL